MLMLMPFKYELEIDYCYKYMTGSGGYRTSKFRVVHVLTGTFKQYYPQTLEVSSVYNGGSLHVSTKWKEKKNF